ncbi:UdgX family uracil-DNA binding protein [Lichenibacterium dinghuense]|uniref:UdgX family uracil-DNA binding protein n=1 Tax=Lichenibacterium dinghuense TaxID=2895977 RepID=UPI001F27E5F3|nr:UdgX family uracil-DNA binding protein [Lichenibacterium sp. 6Y81]
MREVVLRAPDDYEGWRDAARALAEAGVPAEAVVWRAAADAPDLFVSPPEEAPSGDRRALRVPRRFVDLAELVACHRDPERFAFLYRLLCRLQDEPRLLDITTDEDVFRIEMMAKSVRRDRHKMTAFVRFKEVLVEGAEPAYLAWFEPEHHILALTAPFFVERFKAMLWTIVTPEARASWDGSALHFGPGGSRDEVPAEDATEEHWRTYYVNIFNPARLKVDAMKREMPVKYWKNLPEAQLIAPLVRSAGTSEARMVATPQKTVPKRAAAIVARADEARAERDAPPTAMGNNGLEALKREALACTRCDLHQFATQTVFGEGLSTADLVFVGEQPGDKEDLAGKPFIGPAGALFDRALGEAGIDRTRAYVTNAVKHFKFEPRGKRRIHKKPGVGEINACHHWLEEELKILRPRLTIALGASAIRSLTGQSASVLSVRGTVLSSALAGPVFVTVHPSFILRLPDEASQTTEFGRFVADLRHAKARAAGEDSTPAATGTLL